MCEGYGIFSSFLFQGETQFETISMDTTSNKATRKDGMYLRKRPGACI